MTEKKHSYNKFNNLGKALLIVNPVAQSGKGSKSGKIAFNILSQEYKQNVDLIYTKNANDAKKIASTKQGYDTMIAVGGDGVIHETVNGLMMLKRKDRPKFGIIPVGSGNDYARSLGVSFDTKKAVHQLMTSNIKNLDIGKVNDQYFAETLSFGLDAGIALGTMELRKKTNSTGFLLYFKSGIDQILHHYHTYNYTLKLDDKKLDGESIIIAVQNGVTYGGGFQICPKASMEDGLLDICIARGGVKLPLALFMFSLASKGFHRHFSIVSFHRSKTAKLKFSGEHTPKCQIDGEEYTADEYNISMLHKQLDVFFPRKK